MFVLRLIFIRIVCTVFSIGWFGAFVIVCTHLLEIIASFIGIEIAEGIGSMLEIHPLLIEATIMAVTLCFGIVHARHAFEMGRRYWYWMLHGAESIVNHH